MPEHDYEGSREEFVRMLAEQGEEPAFITRRRRLDAAMQQLRWTCQTHRQSLLCGPQMHLRKLATMIDGDWSRLSSRLVIPGQWRVYASLHASVNADSQPPAWANQGLWAVPIDRPLRELARSVDRFNRDWTGYLDRFDLDPINRSIADFNQYYVLEKACALGREDLARLGFQPMPLLTPESLLAEFATIELPHLR